MKGAVVVGIVW